MNKRERIINYIYKLKRLIEHYKNYYPSYELRTNKLILSILQEYNQELDALKYRVDQIEEKMIKEVKS